mgnify:CR=1 FL=1
MRIASLLPATTEIVGALGLADELVAVTFECDEPAGIRERAAVVVDPALPPGLHGTLVMNPPYGERIAVRGSVARSVDETGMADDFFPRLAAHWKRHFGGWTAWVLSPDMKLPSRMRLKESRRVPLWNGPIECRLFRFDIVAGRMRDD